MSFNPNEEVISTLSGGVSASPSANAGKVTVMHNSSASATHRTFLFIMTSKKLFGLPQKEKTPERTAMSIGIFTFLHNIRTKFNADGSFRAETARVQAK